MKTSCDRKGSELPIEQTGTQPPAQCIPYIVVRQAVAPTYWVANCNATIKPWVDLGLHMLLRAEWSFLRPHACGLETRINKRQSDLD